MSRDLSLPLQRAIIKTLNDSSAISIPVFDRIRRNVPMPHIRYGLVSVEPEDTVCTYGCVVSLSINVFGNKGRREIGQICANVVAVLDRADLQPDGCDLKIIRHIRTIFLPTRTGRMHENDPPEWHGVCEFDAYLTAN